MKIHQHNLYLPKKVSNSFTPFLAVERKRTICAGLARASFSWSDVHLSPAEFDDMPPCAAALSLLQDLPTDGFEIELFNEGSAESQKLKT